MQEFQLNNNITTIYKKRANTPRISVGINIAINEPEKFAGVYSLMNRLLTQGTKTRTAEQIADELDKNAIDLCCDLKQDFLRFRILCLNEDFETAVELLSDLLKNSTFSEFDKEKIKMEGEITAEMDSARTKALDGFVRTLFENHYYGNTFTNILKNINNITKEEVVFTHQNILKTGRKVVAVIGDVELEEAERVLNKYFSDIPNGAISESSIAVPVLEKKKQIEIIKEDAQQSQIFQGWLLPTFTHEDYCSIVLFNTILGSSGLSSRLFVNLRDKKGLAYTVRSSYECFKTCGNFNIYIATEPKNIQTSLDGFRDEIQKLKDDLVSEKELFNAKNNFIGKQQFITETNAQQVYQLTYYGIMGLPFDFQKQFIEKIRKVTAEDVKRVANKYFGDISVVAVLKP